MAQTSSITPDDAENAKEPKDTFVPWGPESAAAIARRIKQLWDSNPDISAGSYETHAGYVTTRSARSSTG